MLLRKNKGQRSQKAPIGEVKTQERRKIGPDLKIKLRKTLKKEFGFFYPCFAKLSEKELQPLIERRYKTNTTKYIIGQSLGGLLAIEILVKKPHLFSHYFIVSPSLWWDHESLLKDAQKLLQTHADANIYVSISVGKKENKIMIRDAKKLKKLLLHSNKSKLKVDFNLMRNENHATILHNSIYQALFKLYPL